MSKLITANGEVFEIIWIGVASIDGVLRFCIVNSESSKVFDVFSNSENCKKLVNNNDGIEQIYEDYKIFRGIQVNYDDTIQVSLSKI